MLVHYMHNVCTITPYPVLVSRQPHRTSVEQRIAASRFGAAWQDEIMHGTQWICGWEPTVRKQWICYWVLRYGRGNMRCMKGVYENTDEASPFRRRPDFDLLHLKKWCSGYTTSESISLPDKSRSSWRALWHSVARVFMVVWTHERGDGGGV